MRAAPAVRRAASRPTPTIRCSRLAKASRISITPRRRSSRKRSAPSMMSACSIPAPPTRCVCLRRQPTRPSRSIRSRSRSRSKAWSSRCSTVAKATCARTITSSSSQSIFPRSANAPKRSRSTRKRPGGAGSSLRRSIRPRPCFRPPASWNGRTERSRVTRPPRKTFGGGCVSLSRRCVLLELIVISTLNGVLFGMLLFLMASGLTVIFSMLGVLNFAHASFYMLGAFFGFQISRWFGFWPALLIAPLLAGAIGAGVERYGLRRVHKNGHVAELLFTFGLAFVIEEVVQIIWGKSPVDFRVPPLLDFPAFTIFSTNYPAYKMFMLLVSIVIFVGLLVVLKKTRIGLIVQAALTHPHMVGHLGHNVGRIFMLVFGVGTALAAVAGVIAGPALVTQSNMAGLLGPILFVVVVVGGLGSLPGAFVASLLIGLFQTFAVSMNGSLSAAFGPLSPDYASTWLADIWGVTIAQIAPIMPYVLLVLILIFRPMGLLGTRDTW